jgi:hypothetical protein
MQHWFHNSCFIFFPHISCYAKTLSPRTLNMRVYIFFFLCNFTFLIWQLDRKEFERQLPKQACIIVLIITRSSSWCIHIWTHVRVPKDLSNPFSKHCCQISDFCLIVPFSQLLFIWAVYMVIKTMLNLTSGEHCTCQIAIQFHWYSFFRPAQKQKYSL